MVNEIPGFPNMENFNPQQLVRQFDNEVWNNPDLRFEAKFIRVPWDGDYKDTVHWRTPEMRDAYMGRDFGADQYVLEGGADGVQWDHRDLAKWIEGDGRYRGSIKVAVPSETISKFNYLAVTFKYPRPVPGQRDPEIKFFFFVRAVQSHSPNTTEVFLSLDVWSTYILVAILQGLTLTQGHYPVAEMSASQYLASPVDSVIDLTAVEPNLPSVKTKTKRTELISLLRENPRVCIATTGGWGNESSYWAPYKEGTPPDQWWKGEDLGWDGATPVPSVGSSHVNGGGPGLRVYSISPGDFNNFINTARKKLPQLIKTIKAVYVLPGELINEEAGIRVLGFDLKEVSRQATPRKVAELGIDKALFGYEPENADFAKLYTSQFAELIITSNSGTGENDTATVTLESLAGSLDFYARANSAFPFLKLEAFIDGIGGKGAKNYTVAPWNEQNATIFNSMASDFRFDLDVPVYGVYLDPRQDAALENSIKEWIAAENRKKAYAEATREYEKAYGQSTREINKAYNQSGREIDKAYSQASRELNAAFDIAERDRIAAFNTQRATIQNDFHTTGRTIDTSFTNDRESTSVDRKNTNAEINTTFTNGIDSNNRDFDVATYARELGFNNNTVQILATNDMIKTNQWGAAILHSYNLFQINSSNFMNITSQALSIASSAVSSSLSAISMGAGGGGAMPSGGGKHSSQPSLGAAASGAGAIVGSVSGIVNMGVAYVTGMRQLNITNEMAALSYYNEDMAFQVNHAPVISAPFSYFVTFDGEHPDTFWPGTNPDYNLDQNPLVEREGSLVQIKSVATKVAEIRQAVDTAVNNNTNTTAIAVNLLNKSTNTDIITRGRDTARDNNERLNGTNTTTGVRNDNNARTRNTSDQNNAATNGDNGVRVDNLKLIQGASGSVADDYTQRRNVAQANRDADQTLGEQNRTAEQNLGEANRDAEQALAIENRNANRDLALQEWTANEAESFTSEPNAYGEFSGAGHVDSWGLRGLTVTVNTINKSAERLAGDYFRLRGYTMNSLLVKQPELTRMENWTFWKAEDVWLSAPSISDANEHILKQIFKDGVTIWSDPDSVKNINLPNGVA